MKKVLCVFLVSIMLLSSGCVQKKVYNHSFRDYIVYSMENLPADLLMINRNNIREQDLTLALFEGLVGTDAEGNVIPALASEWAVSEDGLNYTFKMRENAKWSDGSKITAKDFVDFFSRILREEDSIYTSQLEYIFGVKDYADRKIDFNSVAIRAKEDDILEIRLNYPCSYFLDILSNPVFSLKENFYNLRQWKKEYRKIKYSGAFVIDTIYENGEISLKKNDKYWDEKNVLSNKIHIRNDEVSAFALANYKSNDIDILFAPFNQVTDLSQEEVSVKGPIPEGISLNFNLNKGITNNYSFRKAVSIAIDKDDIEDKLNGIIKKSSSYIPKNIKNIGNGNNISSIINENESIQELLSKSNYDGEKLTLVYLNSNENNEKIVNSIVKSLKDSKIKVVAKGFKQEELKEIIYNEEYDMLLTNYVGEYDSPEAFLDNWLINSLNNISDYKNSDFDSYIYKGRISKEKEEVEKNFKEAEKILIKDIPCIPLGFYNVVLYKKPFIGGAEINKRGNIILKSIYTKMPI